MTIQMTPRFHNGLALLDVRGPLTAREAADSGGLALAVVRLWDAGFAHVAVNLAEVSQVDARGLGELILSLRASRDRGVRLSLVAPPPRVRRMLAVTRLDTVFDVHESFGSFGRSDRSDRSAAAEEAVEAEELSSALAV